MTHAGVLLCNKRINGNAIFVFPPSSALESHHLSASSCLVSRDLRGVLEVLAVFLEVSPGCSSDGGRGIGRTLSAGFLRDRDLKMIHLLLPCFWYQELLLAGFLGLDDCGESLGLSL